MFTLIVLMFILTSHQSYAEIEWCGLPKPLCLCDMKHGIILCTNPDTVAIPDFPKYIKQHAWKIILMNTGVHRLVSFTHEEWPALRNVNLRNNKYLGCNTVHKELHHMNVELSGDCGNTSGPKQHTSSAWSTIGQKINSPHSDTAEGVTSTLPNVPSTLNITTFTTSSVSTTNDIYNNENTTNTDSSPQQHVSPEYQKPQLHTTGMPNQEKWPFENTAGVNNSKVEPHTIVYGTAGAVSGLLLLSGITGCTFFLLYRRKRKLHMQNRGNIEMQDLYLNPSYVQSNELDNHNSYYSDSSFDSISLHSQNSA